MLGLLIRGLLLISGFFASFFVAREALKFQIVQMVIAVILFTVILFLAAFASNIEHWIIRQFKKDKK